MGLPSGSSSSVCVACSLVAVINAMTGTNLRRKRLNSAYIFRLSRRVAGAGTEAETTGGPIAYMLSWLLAQFRTVCPGRALLYQLTIMTTPEDRATSQSVLSNPQVRRVLHGDS